MRRRIPSTQALVCFDAAARLESFTKAAESLALTQSAVCRQVAALEEFLDVKLFRRTRHGIALTEAGAQYAGQMAHRLDAMERDTLAVMSHQGAGGALALAVVPTFATRWLLPRLPKFGKLHPDLTVHLETRTRSFLFNDTEFDAALYAGTAEQVADWPGTQAILLMHEEAVPVCSPRLIAPKHDLTPQQVSTLPLLQQSTRPYGWRQWFEAAGLRVVDDLAGPRYELFSMLAMGAAHDMGVALIPRPLIESELARGELVVACDQPLRGERSYYLVVPERRIGHAAIDRFKDWLLAEVQAGSASLDTATSSAQAS
ncbi:LysR family transcriptional regulator [soil metagenome]